MLTLKHLFILTCVGIGLGCKSGDVRASEPGLHSKLLTPSPLGKDRILALCLTGERGSEALAEFYQSVMWSEFLERDLVVVEVSKTAVQSVVKDSQGGMSQAKHHDYGDALRKRADCNDNMDLVLIGKDTGVKMRWEKNFSQEDLFNRIDAMPMRRYEMRKADKN